MRRLICFTFAPALPIMAPARTASMHIFVLVLLNTPNVAADAATPGGVGSP